MIKVCSLIRQMRCIKKTERKWMRKRDFISGNFSYALVIDNISTNHKFDFQHSNIIAFIHDKNKCRIIENSAISLYNTIEQRPRFSKYFTLLSQNYVEGFHLTLTKIIKQTFLSDSLGPRYSRFLSFFLSSPIQTEFL